MSEPEVIVAGHLIVPADRRDTYVEECADVVRAARAATGCRDFAITADTVEPDRVNIVEHWRSAADVEAFRGSGPEGDQADDIVSGHVRQFEVGAANDLF